MWKWMGLFVRKNHLLRCWYWLSLNWIWALPLSLLLKLPPRKVPLSPEVALYLYKSIICPCKEYCYHIWDGAPNCYLELLNKLQKLIYRIVGPSLAASFEPLPHHQLKGYLYLCSWCVINDFFIWRKNNVLFWRYLEFFCFCEIHRFQNLWCHHRHCYIMEVTLILISFES